MTVDKFSAYQNEQLLFAQTASNCNLPLRQANFSHPHNHLQQVVYNDNVNSGPYSSVMNQLKNFQQNQFMSQQNDNSDERLPLLFDMLQEAHKNVAVGTSGANMYQRSSDEPHGLLNHTSHSQRNSDASDLYYLSQSIPQLQQSASSSVAHLNQQFAQLAQQQAVNQALDNVRFQQLNAISMPNMQNFQNFDFPRPNLIQDHTYKRHSVPTFDSNYINESINQSGNEQRFSRAINQDAQYVNYNTNSYTVVNQQKQPVQQPQKKYEKVRSSTGGKSEGLYICNWENCGKQFSRFYNLKSHLKTHTGERPFVCDICPANFSRNHDLKRHKRIHSGDKPYSCLECDRKFSRLDALSRHQQANTCGLKNKDTSISASDSGNVNTNYAHMPANFNFDLQQPSVNQQLFDSQQAVYHPMGSR